MEMTYGTVVFSFVWYKFYLLFLKFKLKIRKVALLIWQNQINVLYIVENDHRKWNLKKIHHSIFEYLNNKVGLHADLHAHWNQW